MDSRKHDRSAKNHGGSVPELHQRDKKIGKNPRQVGTWFALGLFLICLANLVGYLIATGHVTVALLIGATFSLLLVALWLLVDYRSGYRQAIEEAKAELDRQTIHLRSRFKEDDQK